MDGGDHSHNDLDEIAGLRASGVVSLDMETAAIAALCERRGIPWSVFRVISDRATDGSVDEEVFESRNMDGTPNNEAIERFFAEHPERVEAMASWPKARCWATESGRRRRHRGLFVGAGAGSPGVAGEPRIVGSPARTQKGRPPRCRRRGGSA